MNFFFCKDLNHRPDNTETDQSYNFVIIRKDVAHEKQHFPFNDHLIYTFF